jgi:hypothetical protein
VQVQFVRTGQRVVFGERVRERRDRLVQKMEDRTLYGPPDRLWKCLDLLPSRPGESDEAITH